MLPETQLIKFKIWLFVNYFWWVLAFLLDGKIEELNNKFTTLAQCEDYEKENVTKSYQTA